MENKNQNENVDTKKAWYKRWWVILLGVVIFYAIGSTALQDNSIDDAKKKAEEAKQAKNNTSETAKQDEVKKEELLVISAVELSKAYEENEVAADEKYKGKMIETTGKIAGIDNGVTDKDLIVKLSDGKYDMRTTYCYMNASEKDKVIAFKKGQQVTLIGKGSSATLGSPVLKECTVK